MTEVVSTVTTLVTSATGWVGTFADTITSTPIILMFVALPLVGIGIGMLKRLFRA